MSFKSCIASILGGDPPTRPPPDLTDFDFSRETLGELLLVFLAGESSSDPEPLFVSGERLSWRFLLVISFDE